MIIYNKLIKEALEKSWINNKLGYRFYSGKKFCWYIWNLVHPSNRIEKGDGFCIHHKDENKLNDDRKNLEKIELSEHMSIHHDGKECSKETKNKISKANKGRNNYWFGKHFSDKHRENISESHKGEKNYFWRKHHSLETRKRISRSLSGKNGSMFGVHRYGKDAPFYGKCHSEETKNRMKQSWVLRKLKGTKDIGGINGEQMKQLAKILYVKV